MTHAYHTFDARLNFKNISPLTFSTITWIYKFKFVYIWNEEVLRIKKHISYFWMGIWQTISVLIYGTQSITQSITWFRFNVWKNLLHGKLLEKKFTSVTKKRKQLAGIWRLKFPNLKSSIILWECYKIETNGNVLMPTEH